MIRVVIGSSVVPGEINEAVADKFLSHLIAEGVHLTTCSDVFTDIEGVQSGIYRSRQDKRQQHHNNNNNNMSMNAHLTSASMLNEIDYARDFQHTVSPNMQGTWRGFMGDTMTTTANATKDFNQTHNSQPQHVNYSDNNFDGIANRNGVFVGQTMHKDLSSSQQLLQTMHNGDAMKRTQLIIASDATVSSLKGPMGSKKLSGKSLSITVPSDGTSAAGAIAGTGTGTLPPVVSPIRRKLIKKASPGNS